MVPIDGFIDDKETPQIEKADARASCIDQRRKQFAISTPMNADPPQLVGTSDASFDINRSESDGIYREDYDIYEDGNLSYHSSDGSDKMTLMLICPWATARKAPLPQQTHVLLLNSPPLGGRWMTYRTGSRK